MSAGCHLSSQVGDVVEGVVQSLRLYGAFLDLGNGNLGLLHVSQISHEHIVGVDKILREGDRLKVRVTPVATQASSSGPVRWLVLARGTAGTRARHEFWRASSHSCSASLLTCR